MDFQVAQVDIPAALERPAALVELQSLRGTSEEAKDEIDAGNGIRFKAIRQEGLRVGAQAGLSYRYGMILAYLENVESKLNVTFSFAGFVRDGRLLIPAVIQTPNQFVDDREKNEVRVVRDSYTIQEEARIISVVPTWRDYIWQEYAEPERPHHSLLPRSEPEIKAWEDALKLGWSAGISQADEIYTDRLNQLASAVEGRHLYVTLEQKKMLSPAALNVVANKVTFNGRTMNVGEAIYTIGNGANYTNSNTWRPVWTRQ